MVDRRHALSMDDKNNFILKSQGPAKDPIHARAPRTRNPRRLVLPIGENILGEVSQDERAAVSAEAHQNGSAELTSGQQHQARTRLDLWSEEEISTLRRLCSAYDGTRVRWTDVEAEFKRLHRPRTKAALAAKWRVVKQLATSGGEGADLRSPSPTPEDQQEKGLARFGEEGTSPSEDPKEAAAGEVKAHTPAVASDNPANMAELMTDPRFCGFRKAFNGYFRWAAHSFDREPVKRVALDCPKELFAMADALIANGCKKALRPNESEIGRLNGLVYAAARTIYQFWKQEVDQRQQGDKGWYAKTRVDRDKLAGLISKLERELARRKEKRKPSLEELRVMRDLVKELGTRSTSGLSRRLEVAKQRLRLLRDRISLREQESRRKQLRKRFAETPSLKLLTKEEKSSKSCDVSAGGVTMKSVIDFWKPIIGTCSSSDPDRVPILKQWRDEQDAKYPNDLTVEREEIRTMYESSITKIHPWKATGPDGLHAYWWKTLPTARRELCKIVTEWLTTGKVHTKWVCRGRTVLIPKKGDKSDASNYRPITCLNTCYKVLTAVINKIILSHVGRGDSIPDNQRALRKHEWGCTHALVLDRAMVMDATSQKKHSLSMGWLDYRKAYDSISHDYVRWLLGSIKLPRIVTLALTRLMSNWATTFELRLGQRKVKSEKVNVLNGIFQGDALSPTLFVLCMAPISYALDKGVEPCRSASGWSSGYGFAIGHQFYMDDLKLYARSAAELDRQIQIVSEVSEAIGLRLNLSKCAKVHYSPHGGEVSNASNEETTVDASSIPLLGFRSTYKYLGVQQRLLPEEIALKEFEDALLQRAETIFASELTWGQMASAFNNIAIAGMRYVYMNTNGACQKLLGALKRANTLDVRIREILKRQKCRFRASCVERLYIPREFGGYGLCSVEDVLQESILATYSYVVTHPCLGSQHYFFERRAARGKRTITSDGQKVLTSFGIDLQVNVRDRTATVDGLVFSNPTKLNRYLVRKVSEARTETRIQAWKGLSLAGRFLNDKDIDLPLSCLWIKKGYVSAKNLRDVLAVQEGSLLTRSCPATCRDGSQQDRSCRCCRQAPETVEHVTSSCAHWLPNLYVERHDSVARNLLYTICARYGVPPVHYSNRVAPVMENNRCRILWNVELQTKTPMKHRKPDIVVFDLERKEILVFEISVAHRSGLKKQREIKLARYTANSDELPDESQLPYPPGPNLVGDLMAVYGQPVKFVPVVVGTCGEHLVETNEDLQRVLGLTSVKSKALLERISRSAVIGTARIVRAHLACR